jgi:hypothetical protein
MRTSALLLILLAAAPCAAQRTPKPVPADLVTALFAGGQSVGRGATYAVGELPAGWPAELTPPGSAAVGGMADGRRLVALFADTSRNPVARFITMLSAAGFSQPAPRGGSGFMSSDGPFSWYCRDSTNVVATMAPAPANARWLRVSYATGMPTACVRREPSMPEPAISRSILALPELPPPTGVMSGRAGSSASEDHVSSYTILSSTSVTPTALAEHYTRLLTAAGWTTAAAASDSSSAVQLLRARDAGGRPWQGALFVHATTKGRNVFLEMRPEEVR